MRVAETHSLLLGDLLASVVIQKVCVLMPELRSSVILIQGSSLNIIILVPIIHCQSVQVEASGQLAQICSLLPLCES